MRVIALFLALAGGVSALTVEEVLQLSEAGVGDDIILEQMKADGSTFELRAADILDLQKRGVSTVVIRHMVSARGTPALPADAGRETPAPAREPEQPAQAEDAGLVVRNLAKVILSVLVDLRARELVFVQGEIEGATALFNGSHATLSLPSGLYAIRWSNEDSFRELALARNVTTELEFRDDERFPNGVRAVAIVDGIEEADTYAVPTYVDGGEPVWDGHTFIDVSTHIHGSGCGHWYYDNCWNLYPENHLYTQPGYSRCGDTGGFIHSGASWARIWDGWAFLFLRAHVHGAGCGHFYHHGCWNSFASNHVFTERGRGHFNASPPRRRVDVSRERHGSGSSRREERAPQRQPARRVEQAPRRQPAQRVEQAPQRQPAQRVEQAPRRQPAQRVEQAPRRQPAQRVEQAPRRQPAQRVEQAPRRQPAQRVEQAPRRQPAQRVEQAPRRQPAQRVEQAPRRESSPRPSSQGQRQPSHGSRGERR